MLSLIKKLIFREYLYPYVRKTLVFTMRHALNAKIAAQINWNPAQKLFVIWVTGTDGKTTTCLLIQHVVNKLAWKCIAITTESVVIDKEKISNTLKMSSLSPYLLHKYLDRAVDSWCKFAVLETTSHGLDQKRFDSINFSCWVLTNITPEHLDYHGTMEKYALAKRRLFDAVIANDTAYKRWVMPKDDERWRKRSSELSFDKVIDYSVTMNSTLKAENIVTSLQWTTFDVKYLWQLYPVNTKLVWKFNVYNYLAAFAVAIHMSWEPQTIIKALEDYTPIDGRQDIIYHNDVTYVVDFAHTPNWLKNILELISSTPHTGRIITLFWAPGKRDHYKRPEMWSIVESFSDIIILTEDDSLTEPTQKILSDVMAGITKQEWDNYYVIPHRLDAVRFATQIAQAWDIVLLAWKWHERHLYTNFWRLDYHERTFLKELLSW